MTHADNFDDKHRLEDRVNNPISADANPISILHIHDFLYTAMKWIFRQLPDSL